MKTIELSYPHTMLQSELPKAVCAIGFFDGIHKGHQKVINIAVKEAEERNLESVVITFHPHPSVVLNKDVKAVKYITPLKEKQRILQQLKVDRLYIIKFNEDLSLLSPKHFIKDFIIGLNIQHVVAGFDFTYGHKGKGNMKDISNDANGLFTSTTVDKLEENDEKISSTRIRKRLDLGKVTEANFLLGRNLSVSGIVVEGDKRGRTIGYPTANINVPEDALLPKLGVYAVKVKHKSNIYYGMANLGIKPTFELGDIEPSLEVFLFDFGGDLYGQELIVEWHSFVRNEQKFAGIEELVQQLSNDEQEIRQYFLNKRVQN